MATPIKKPAAPSRPAPKVNTQVHKAAPPAQQTRPPQRPANRAAPAPAKTAVARPAARAVTAHNPDVPAYIKQNQTRGSENVAMQDVVIPRIELVQALSPAIDKSAAGYIEGAEQGMLFNSVTRELYGEQVQVCPVYFRKQWLVWKDRKKGGGFGGAFDTPEEARARIEEEDADEQGDWDIQETAQQIVLVYDENSGDSNEAVVSMSRTKLKISRQWNSLIRINGFDRFSRMYSLFGVDDQNANGDKFKNLGVSALGFSPKPLYDKAETLYEAISGGTRTVKVDDVYEEDAIPGEATEATGEEPPTPEY